jgi:predicted dehydrogenase
MAKLGIAIIGIGYMEAHHLRALLQLKRLGLPIEIIGVCDQNSTRLNQFSKQKSVSILTTSPRKLLGHPNVDTIFITTPWHSHYDLVSESIHAQKHIYCEKPLASNYSEVVELSRQVSNTQLQAQAGLLLRHQPSIWKIKTILDSGELGPVTMALLREDSCFPHKGKVFQTGLAERLQGRGILWEENIHDLDMLLYFFGPLDLKNMHLLYHADLPNVETGATLRLENMDKAPIHFISQWHDIEYRTSSRHLEIICENGMILSDYFTSGDLRIQKSGDKKPKLLREDTIRKEYIAHHSLDKLFKTKQDRQSNLYARFSDAQFIKALLNGKTVSPDFEEAKQEHKLIDQIYSNAQ